MRVAHVITRMIIGGAQENTLLNCLDLRRDFGDDVLLITGPTQGPEGDLLSQGRAGDLNVRVVASLRRAIDPRRDREAYRQLLSELASFQPDVVHTHSAKGGMLGRGVAWRLRVPAVVHTVHGAPFHPYQPRPVRWFYRSCERWAAQRCHRMISVADAMTDLLVTAGVAPREKFTTIYSGMDTGPFLNADSHRSEMRQKLGFEDRDVVVGKVARLFELKGHEFVIAAAAEAVQRRPELRFLFVGDGILRKTLQRQIDAAGLKEHFVFAGLVPPEEVPRYLGAMDVLVHTSLREGLARALPQALLAGKPVVSYDIDGAREVVIDGMTGRLLPPRSVGPLAEALTELAGDPGRRAAMGSAGRELCGKRFDHRYMTRRIRELYEETLAGG